MLKQNPGFFETRGIALVILIIGLVAFSSCTTNSIAHNDQPAMNETAAAGILGESLGTAAIVESNSSIIINASYPRHANPAIDQAVEAFVSSEISSFRNQSQSGMHVIQGVPDTLYITYSNYTTEKTFSVAFEAESYFNGMAHPSHETTTMNFWSDSGEPILLPDIFNSSSYLQALSNITAEELAAKLIDSTAPPETAKLERDLIAAGTAPNAGNFREFLISSDGLIIIFQEYQVAPYYFGPQQVVVPWSSISSITRPELGFV
jgi:hypothetical protein